MEPVVGRKRGLIGVEQLQGSESRAPARAEERGHARGGEARQVPLEDQGLHRRASAADRRIAPARAAWLE